jgi:hypothetical protein
LPSEFPQCESANFRCGDCTGQIRPVQDYSKRIHALQQW